MMKRCLSFTSLLLLALQAVAAAASRGVGGGDSINNPQRRLDRTVQKLLLQHAVPVDAHGNPRRRLNQNQQDEQGEQGDFQLTGTHSLQFYKCASISSQPETDDILFDQNLIPYTSSGKIAAQKSFVLFNVCETAYCDFYAGDENLYMIDVATYMTAISVNYQDRTESYCSACANSENYCAWITYQKANGDYDNSWNEYQQAEAEEQAEAAAAGQDGVEDQGGARRRKLAENNNNNNNNPAYEVVECDQCESMGCWDEEADELEGQAGQWVQNIAQCPQTNFDFFKEINVDDDDGGKEAYPLYSGFMCNQDGTGVEIALFLEATCSIYDGVHSYYDMLKADDDSATDELYLQKAAEMIMFPFLHEINCNGQLVYLSLQDWYRNYSQNYQAENNNNNKDGQNNNNNMQVSEYCKSLFEGQQNSGKAISLNDCDANGEKDERAQGQEQVEEYGEYNGNNAEADYMYKYILSYENSLSSVATCQVVRALDGEYEMIYKWDTSGQLFDYGTHGTSKHNGRPVRKWLSQFDAMDITLVSAIIVGILVSVLALGCVLCACCSPGKLPRRYAMHKRQLDEHRERLVDPNTGELA